MRDHSAGDRGEPEDLSASLGRTGEEHAVAAALRTSLHAGPLPDGHAGRLVGSVLHRAARRRRRRRGATAAVAAVCCAAAVLLSAGAVRDPRHGTGGVAATVATSSPSTSAGDVQVWLSTAEVAAVVPGAGRAFHRGKYWPDPPETPPGGVCDTGALVGVAVPLHAERGEWDGETTATTEVLPDGSTSYGTSTVILLVATGLTWATADQADGYATAFASSGTACSSTSAPDVRQVLPAPTFLDGGGSLFTTYASEGGWGVSALAVLGDRTVLLEGRVPGPPTDAGRRAAATALARLAETAVRRAAAS